MDNNLKLTLIRIFLALKIVFNILLIVGGIIAASMISKFQYWNDHSNKVINEIVIVRNQFQTADYTARNRTLTGIEQSDLNSLRQEVYHALDRLKTVVGDNPKQVKNIDELKAAIVNRFLTQDEQFRSVVRQNGSITYPSEVVMRSTQYLEHIETLFSEIKMVEINLLRLERAPNVFKWQWYTIYFTGFVIAASLAISIYLNVMLQQSVVNTLMVNSLVRKADTEKDSKFVHIPRENFERWKKLLQGDG